MQVASHCQPSNGMDGGRKITNGRKRWHCHACPGHVSASVKALVKVHHVGDPKWIATSDSIMTTCTQWSSVVTAGDNILLCFEMESHSRGYPIWDILSLPWMLGILYSTWQQYQEFVLLDSVDCYFQVPESPVLPPLILHWLISLAVCFLEANLFL